MPVLISADRLELDLVRPLARRLVQDGGEVRCYLEEDDHELRQEGCKVAVGDLTDEDTLEAALTNVHTFIPILPDPAVLLEDKDLVILEEIGLAAAGAAERSGINQTILSIPGLAAASELGAVYRKIRERFEDRVNPLCLITTGMLWGDSRPFRGAVGSLHHDQEVDVVHADEFVQVLAAADDREDLNGAWELAGERVRSGVLAASLGASGESQTSSLLSKALSPSTPLGNSAYDEFNVARQPVLR